MQDNLIETYEHQPISSLSEEELVGLLKEPTCLIDCVDLKNKTCQTGYFIGLARMPNSEKVLFVKPKLDKYSRGTDYLRMLSVCLQHPEVLAHTKGLFQLDFKKPPISIRQKEDLITPLIVIQFLHSVHRIVQKGIQKRYYKIVDNMRSAVKGKILVGKTIKQNHFRNRNLHTFCQYDEFGIHNMENKLIKKALSFILRYAEVWNNNRVELSTMLNFILPAFAAVEGDLKEKEVRHPHFNILYDEYHDAVQLGLLILKRFGYNINTILPEEEVEVHPFWIDMSKLFELYVLGKLKDSLGSNDVIFQAEGKYGNLDFLRITQGNEMVIDAKYKLAYKQGEYKIEDIRQLSGYARDKGIFHHLAISPGSRGQTVLPCVIIYPDDDAEVNIHPNNLLANPIPAFENFYKLGISVPQL